MPREITQSEEWVAITSVAIDIFKTAGASGILGKFYSLLQTAECVRWHPCIHAVLPESVRQTDKKDFKKVLWRSGSSLIGSCALC